MKNPMIFAAAPADSRGHGLSLRDYFVAHAPPVPTWFKPTMPDKKPHPRWRSVNNMLEFDSALAAERACGKGGYEDVNAKARVAWEENYWREADLQWPLYWANEQLNRR